MNGALCHGNESSEIDLLIVVEQKVLCTSEATQKL
jgi:hypothetical protein